MIKMSVSIPNSIVRYFYNIVVLRPTRLMALDGELVFLYQSSQTLTTSLCSISSINESLQIRSMGGCKQLIKSAVCGVFQIGGHISPLVCKEPIQISGLK